MLTAPRQDAEQAPSGIPCPDDAHPDSYGLTCSNGAGALVPPGSTVIVEPNAPTGAGLAVFYRRGQGPQIWDLTHNFSTDQLLAIASTSTVRPTIELVAPDTGRIGCLPADAFEKVHRIAGVYVPDEILRAQRPLPPKLPLMQVCPDGMGEQFVGDAVAYPLVRPRETVVYDPAKRDLVSGALYVVQFGNGPRSVLQINQRTVGDAENAWWVDPINQPTQAAIDRMIAARSGTTAAPIVAHTSDGPYTAEHLLEYLVGHVVGILVPGPRKPRDGGPIDATAKTVEQGAGPDLERSAVAPSSMILAACDQSFADLIQEYEAAHALLNQVGDMLYDAKDSLVGHSYTEQMKICGRLRARIALYPAGDWPDVMLKIRACGVSKGVEERDELRKTIEHQDGRAFDTDVVESVVLDLLGFLDTPQWDAPASARVKPVSASDTQPQDLEGPFLEALHRHAGAYGAFSKAVASNDARNMSEEASVALEIACAQERRAWRDLFKVRPHTLHQLWLLLRHVAEHHEEHDGIEDGPDVFGGLAAAANGLRIASGPYSAPHDLSRLSICELEDLADICDRQHRALRNAMPDSAVGDILDRESTRIGLLGNAAEDEIERRKPANETERDLRLETLVRAHLAGNGYIEPGLMKEVVAAWGA